MVKPQEQARVVRISMLRGAQQRARGAHEVMRSVAFMPFSRQARLPMKTLY